MTRAAIYARISRYRVGAGLGVERQRQDCLELIASRGWTVAETYADNDLSAYTGKPRPGYRRLLADITAGRVDVVVAWHTDRLHRQPIELEEYIAACDQHGVPTHTVKAGPLDLATPSGRLVARQLGAVARYEVEHSIERQQRAKQQAAAAGKWRGGRRPYGYASDGVTLVPDEAEEIRRATREVILGASLRALAANLNARCKTTSTGRPWTATELRKVLRRGRNAGLVEAGGDVVATAVWPAIVTEQEWRACLAVLGDPDRRTNRSNVARRWLGSGLYLCEVCGGTVKASRATVRNGEGTVVYRCHKKDERGKPHVIRRADYTDEFVEAVVLGWLARPEVAAHLVSREETDVGALQAEATALRGQLDDAARQFAARAIDGRQLAIITKAVRADLEAVTARIAAAVSTSPVADLLTAEDLADAWTRLDISRRQAVVDVICTVTLRPGRRGRPLGWKPGNRYFDPESVRIRWRE